MPGPSYHGRTHKPTGTDPVPGPEIIDSTENVGDEWGVHSIDPDDGNEADNLFLGSTGDGGSVWRAIGQSGIGFPAYLDAVLTDYAYYKLNEVASANWADSSGGGRDATYISVTNTTRGVAGYVNEGEAGGPLAVYLNGGTPGASHPATWVGATASSDFFRFLALQPFTVAFWLNPDFATSGGVHSWGVVGTMGQSAATANGWGIYVEPTTLRIDFLRGNRNATGMNRLRSVTNLVQGVQSYVQCSWTGATMHIYLNGVLDASGITDNAGSATTPYSMPSGLPSAGGVLDVLKIGGIGVYESLGTNAPLKGTLDSLLVTDVDLSSIAADLYAAAVTTIIADTSMIGSGDALEGEVISADGAGGTEFAYPTLKVTY